MGSLFQFVPIRMCWQDTKGLSKSFHQESSRFQPGLSLWCLPLLLVFLFQTRISFIYSTSSQYHHSEGLISTFLCSHYLNSGLWQVHPSTACFCFRSSQDPSILTSQTLFIISQFSKLFLHSEGTLPFYSMQSMSTLGVLCLCSI